MDPKSNLTPFQLAPYIVLKSAGPIEKKMLDHLAAGNFFLHKTGPHAPKLMYVLNRFSGFFKNAMKIYIPAHLIILLLRLRGKKDSKGTLLKKYLIGVLRSTLFVALFASSISISRVTPPLYGIFTNKMGSWAGFTISFLFSCAFLIESSQRWPDMALYVLGQWFEAFPRSLVKRKYVPPVKHAEKLLLALAIGMMVWIRYTEDPTIEDGRKRDKMSIAVDFLVGRFDHQQESSKTETLEVKAKTE